MSTGTYGRTALWETSKGRNWKFNHEFEHRGNGIVAIYSYGPVSHHSQLVREAKRVMRDRFGVSDAVSSGGISGWPQDGGSREDRTVETQTVFCIHAVGGPNRPKLKEIAPSAADWHMAYIVDIEQEYLGDGEANRYFTGPLEDEETWRELVDRSVCEVLEDDYPEADKAEVLELKVRATPHGAYWFLNDGDPVVEIKRFEVTP